MTLIRLAAMDDADELTRMRWDYSEEERRTSGCSYEEFHSVCRAFFEKAFQSRDWFIWVAETGGRIVSHVYLQLIHKVPRPGKKPDPYFGYVTNVYTRPGFRSQGIGTRIQQAMEQWSKDNEVEFLILWPSAESVPFYERNGFLPSPEAVEKHW